MRHMNGSGDWRWLFVQGFLCAYECLVVWANSVSVGIVSNLWPPTRGPPSLLMADVRCLPGKLFEILICKLTLTSVFRKPNYYDLFIAFKHLSL